MGLSNKVHVTCVVGVVQFCVCCGRGVVAYGVCVAAVGI